VRWNHQAQELVQDASGVTVRIGRREKYSSLVPNHPRIVSRGNVAGRSSDGYRLDSAA
jgi:hypothetical protein